MLSIIFNRPVETGAAPDAVIDDDDAVLMALGLFGLPERSRLPPVPFTRREPTRYERPDDRTKPQWPEAPRKPEPKPEKGPERERQRPAPAKPKRQGWQGQVATLRLSLRPGSIAEIQGEAECGPLATAKLALHLGSAEVEAGAEMAIASTLRADVRKQWELLTHYRTIAEDKAVARVLDELMILGETDGLMVRELVEREFRGRRHGSKRIDTEATVPSGES